jgi:hypothetical protein
VSDHGAHRTPHRHESIAVISGTDSMEIGTTAGVPDRWSPWKGGGNDRVQPGENTSLPNPAESGLI